MNGDDDSTLSFAPELTYPSCAGFAGLMMAQKGIHVVPDGRGWAIRRAGASRASGLFQTQTDAVRVARDKARAEAGELYIHGTDGRIRERNTYGADPFPPKG